MHRCTHNAAGGTIHRLKPGLATVCSRLRNDNKAIVQFLPSNSPNCLLFWVRSAPVDPMRRCKQKMRLRLHQAGKRNRFIAIGNRWLLVPLRGGRKEAMRRATTRPAHAFALRRSVRRRQVESDSVRRQPDRWCGRSRAPQAEWHAICRSFRLLQVHYSE